MTIPFACGCRSVFVSPQLNGLKSRLFFGGGVRLIDAMSADEDIEGPFVDGIQK